MKFLFFERKGSPKYSVLPEKKQGANFAVDCVSNVFSENAIYTSIVKLLQKYQKRLQAGKIGKFMKKNFEEKKTFSPQQKTSLTTLEREFVNDYWTSCYVIHRGMNATRWNFKRKWCKLRQQLFELQTLIPEDVNVIRTHNNSCTAKRHIYRTTDHPVLITPRLQAIAAQ